MDRYQEYQRHFDGVRANFSSDIVHLTPKHRPEVALCGYRKTFRSHTTTSIQMYDVCSRCAQRAATTLTEAQKMQTSNVEDFKKEVLKTMRIKIDEYGLDICEDGIEDFCSTLGIDYMPPVQFEVTITIENLRGRNMDAYDARQYVRELQDEIGTKIDDILRGDNMECDNISTHHQEVST